VGFGLDSITRLAAVSVAILSRLSRPSQPIFASYARLIGLDSEAAFAALRMIVRHLCLVEGPG
jgi:hypothetical protein